MKLPTFTTAQCCLSHCKTSHCLLSETNYSQCMQSVNAQLTHRNVDNNELSIQCNAELRKKHPPILFC